MDREQFMLARVIKKPARNSSSWSNMAPFAAGISNQFVVDLKKIADLKPLLNDYLPDRQGSDSKCHMIKIMAI